MNQDHLMAVLLAALAAPGFWKIIETLLGYLHEQISGEKRTTMDSIAASIETLTQLSKEQRKDIDQMQADLKDMRAEESVKDAQGARRRILRFNDELLRNIDHSKEYFDDILEDVDTYEEYCRSHPDFPNGKTVMAVKNIRRCYEQCLEKHSFLT